MLRAEDQCCRDDPILQHLLAVVDVVEKAIQGMEALREAGLDASPLGARDDARDEIEREDALGALGVVVDRERDASTQKGGVDRGPSLVEVGHRQASEPIRQTAVMRSHPVGSALREHLVEEGGVGLVGGTDDGHGREGRREEEAAGVGEWSVRTGLAEQSCDL